jgi:hypothetical protein
MTQVVEHMHSKLEVLNSTPSTSRKKKRNKQVKVEKIPSIVTCDLQEQYKKDLE